MIHKSIYPKKLDKKSHIRVIAPSRSMKIISDSVIQIAANRLNEHIGKISFGKHVQEIDEFLSSSVSSRLEDLHDAFADKTVDAVFTAIGGYNAIQLIDKIDYELIRKNPKIMCGFSDITVLSNAIYSQTGLVGYSGPHFSSWGMKKGFDYSKENALSCLFSNKPYSINPSSDWSDDPWYIDQENRKYINNKSFIPVNNGSAEGIIVGGHFRCFASLQGTKYWPGIKNTILFVEENEAINIQLFDRMLQSLFLQPDFSGVRGIVIGRFQIKSDVANKDLIKVIKSKKELVSLPVIIGCDFGHTTPITTYPIGGVCHIISNNHSASITVLEH